MFDPFSFQLSHIRFHISQLPIDDFDECLATFRQGFSCVSACFRHRNVSLIQLPDLKPLAFVCIKLQLHKNLVSGLLTFHQALALFQTRVTLP